MPLFDRYVQRKRVNIIKQVKIKGKWKLLPAVIESNGTLKDRVRHKGRVETHPEGIYFIEWRDSDKRRRRMSVTSREEVIERARLKALELEGVAVPTSGSHSHSPIEPQILTPTPFSISKLDGSTAQLATATSAILGGIQQYLQHLSALATPQPIAASAAPAIPIAAVPAPTSPLAIPTPGLNVVPPPETATTIQPTVATPAVSRSARSSGLLIAKLIDDFLKNVEPPHRSKATYDEYRWVLHMFRDITPKTILHQVEREDLLKFRDHLLSIGNQPRTVFNRLGIVKRLFTDNGVPDLLRKTDKPTFVKKNRLMYQPEQLKALFSACGPDDRILFLFFLLTGERKAEVQFSAWYDIDFNNQCVRVSRKPELGFDPKDKEEREIPVPAQLIAALKEYKRKQTGPNPHQLLFPGESGIPDSHLDRRLKRVAHKAGLNCGRCVGEEGKCADGPYCSWWILHRFRHNFATNALESGVSIRTLLDWMGHSDLKTVMIYLKYVKRKDINQLVDNTQLAGLSAPFMEAYRKSQLQL